MKRIFALLLALAVTLSLFACGGEAGDKKPGKTPAPTASAAPPLEVEGDALGTPVVDTDRYSFAVSSVNTQPTPNGAIQYPLALGFTAENKTADRELTFSVNYIAVNGLPVFWKQGQDYDGTVPAGGTVSNTVTFTYSGVPNEFCTDAAPASCAAFWLAVKDDGGQEEFYKIHVYPQGKADARPYARQSQPADRLFYDDNGVKLTYVGTTADEREAYFYIENNTDSRLRVSITGVKLNGVQTEAGDGIFAYDRTVNYDYIRFSKSDFQKAGVAGPGDIRTLELTFDLVFNDLDSSFGRRVENLTATVDLG